MKKAYSPSLNANNMDLRAYKTKFLISSVHLVENAVRVSWDDGHEFEFDKIWLQDNCPCSQCKHPKTLEPIIHFSKKHFSSIDKAWEGNNGLHVSWLNGHHSHYSNAWLRAHTGPLPQGPNPSQQTAQCFWNASSLKLSTFQYSSMNTPAEFYAALCELRRLGVVIIKDVPPKDMQVIHFAEQIGTVRPTIFGKYFDVVAKVEPNSNGYTSFALYPHIDLAYYANPPAYQCLHFLDNDTEGGLSTLVDGFKVAQALKKREPRIFQELIKPAFTFRFQDTWSEHSFKGPIIELD